MKPIPMLASDLIKELDAANPPRPPRLGDAERQIWWDAGQRALIDNLKLRLEKSTAKGSVLERR